MQHGYSYAATLAASQQVNWRIEDVIGGRRLDFGRPFLPESLARIGALGFLGADERLALNHIRGHGYLAIFVLVEDFILPFVLDHARPTLAADDMRTRALLQFAGEEAKHIQLFKRFRAAFESGFGAPCAVIGPPAAVAEVVLAQDPLSVALLILHIEWMTQRHYLDSVKDDQALDPLFKSLLKHHWLEEAQHAKLDTLMVEALAASRSAEEVGMAVDGYVQLGAMLDSGLADQVAFDIESFTRITGRALDGDEREAFMTAQHQAMRWTFIGSGMSHPAFLATVDALSPLAAARLREIAPAFC